MTNQLFEFMMYAVGGFWRFIGIFILTATILYYSSNLTLFVIRRMLRTLNILFRGWPPEHVNADGDFKLTNTK